VMWLRKKYSGITSGHAHTIGDVLEAWGLIVK